MTNIDKWFLNKFHRIVQVEEQLSHAFVITIPADKLKEAKQLGFSDRQLANCMNSLSSENSITPSAKQIDTVAAEFPAFTNDLYTTCNASEHDVTFNDRGIIVLGSKQVRQAVVINYNPETVSTDYDKADRLYFENISLETILDIYDTERSSSFILSMDGQTPKNIALPLERENVKIYGTCPKMVDTAENHYNFSRLLDEISVNQPLWKELTSFEEAQSLCNKVGYPVHVRPSYVLSGAAMNLVATGNGLLNCLTQATAVSRDHHVVITKYIEQAKEIEMDAIARDRKMIMHYISENTGVHSSDATLIHPPQDLDPVTIRQIEAVTAQIGNALNDSEIKVIECSLRAAQSFPFVSKVTGIDAIEMATKVIVDRTVTPYPDTNLPPDYVGVKLPQFSFSRLPGADHVLGVEMASTGEVAYFGKDKYKACIKGLISTGFVLLKEIILFSIGGDREKLELLPTIQKLHAARYNIFVTNGTADFLQEHNHSLV
ncbi:carbamoyl-phosphate synthetase 2 [Flagelloscypha sp. PMI_526]|nr:carbamoyl-phosphate synthetase 2 [Flagelloscypha sp. PMI_526]